MWALAIKEHLAGKASVFFCQFGGDDVLDAELLRDDVYQHGSGGRDNDHVVARGAVGTDKFPGLGIDGGSDQLVHGVSGDGAHFLHGPPRDHCGELIAASVHAFAGEAGKHIAGFRQGELQCFGRGDEPVVQKLAAKGIGRGGGDDGFIEIEKRRGACVLAAGATRASGEGRKGFAGIRHGVLPSVAALRA